MKKTRIITMLLTAATLSTAALTVSAAQTPTVSVTIVDGEGNLALAQGEIAVTDTDGDGALTIHDALYLAHEAYFAEGTAGYGVAQTDYGLSMTKLWGYENGGGYGYYRNDAAAMSLGDVIADGDRINAFVYTDTATYSDTYCYFDIQTATLNSGDALTLTLMAAGYDANWNPVTIPVADAKILVDGSASAYMTDAEGTVTISLTESGTHIISAASDHQILVPPCCKVTVAGETTTATTTTTASGVETGDASPVAALALAGAALTVMVTRRKKS